MAVPLAYHESLPYIDPQPSSPSLKAANLLIQEELASQKQQPQPEQPPSPNFTETIQSELARVANKESLPPLDLSRYEAQESLLPAQTASETPSEADHNPLLPALSRSYVSHAYLTSRAQNLSLLDKYGKNAWLVGNHQMEEELRSLETQLADTKRRIDIVNLERSRRQEEVRGEVEGLEEGWKKGVGRVLETEVAVEELRREIREEMRRQGGGTQAQALPS